MAGSDLEPESDEFGDRVDGVAIIGVGVVDLAARNTVDQRSAAFESLGGSCVGEASVKGARTDSMNLYLSSGSIPIAEVLDALFV
jgi:hypothetical protein